MTATEARSRCARLGIRPWDEQVIATGITRVTASFLAASPQVSPVAGAPGVWWIGASGLDAIGGERALVRTLLRIARGWHPRARVAIASSCVAARAATWSDDGARSVTVVPPDECAAYLAPLPLSLVPMDAELRLALHALGLRTVGSFAALESRDVEQRWGDTGLTALRLARGDDGRRPALLRPESERTVAAELSMPAATMEPVLFLVRAALDRLVHDLVADARAAAAIAITVTLDDGRGPLPSGGHAHTVTREVRPARALARVVPLFERCRALLESFRLTAPVCGVTVAITATAPAPGEQGDLLDTAWRDPAAADAAFARLRAELGAEVVVRPVACDEHRPERAGAWVDIESDETTPARGAPPEQNIGRGTASPTTLSPPVASGDRALTPLRTLRLLETPEAVNVECTGAIPVALWRQGQRITLTRAIGPERLSGDWWKDSYHRDYWRCRGEDQGELLLLLDHATTAEWYVQGWYD